VTGAPTHPAAAATVYKDKDLERLIASVIAEDVWFVEGSLDLPGLCELGELGFASTDEAGTTE
jgi:hypothetical protein